MSACADRPPAGGGDGELVLRWRVVPVVGDGGGRLELQKAWGDGPWRTSRLTTSALWVKAKGLTRDGHEFLDAARNNSLCERAKRLTLERPGA